MFVFTKCGGERVCISLTSAAPLSFVQDALTALSICPSSPPRPVPSPPPPKKGVVLFSLLIKSPPARPIPAMHPYSLTGCGFALILVVFRRSNMRVCQEVSPAGRRLVPHADWEHGEGQVLRGGPGPFLHGVDMSHVWMDRWVLLTSSGP